MNQRELVRMERELGEKVAFCYWCQQWKPYSRMYKSSTSRDGLARFLGVTTCNSCYNRFRNAVSDEAIVGRLLGWIERNTGITIKVETSDTGFLIHRENQVFGKD